jgi:hypothetical protein
LKKIFYVLLVSCIGLTVIISCKITDDITDDTTTTDNATTTEDISFDPSSVPDNATTVAFGQTYQYQLNTGGTYSGSITYSLGNVKPDNMTISSSGLVEWTPSKNSDITNSPHTITITLTTASGYVLTQTYDLAVTGTCVSGNVLAIWTGDQRSSTDSTKFISNITAYTDNSSDICGRNNNQDCTPAYNYDYNTVNSVSENLHIGPATSADDGIMFFYNQYDNTTHTYLFWMFGKGGASFSPSPNTVNLDVFVSKNASQDSNPVDDDPGETDLISQSQSGSTGLYTSSYTGRYRYGSSRSDGGVIGPFSGTNYRIFVDRGGTSTINSDTLTLGNLDSFMYWSKDNSSFSLGNVDNFTVGYKTSIDCSN